ncbi:LysR family transcriptional regulator [Tahibacter amnicola]|uniref:LysR family transcriptional regulator n=1 Tax=Tahibacter amnicola TaxID=2976241 RepID=A0ABY6B855_9GAMM|nr:LysR family transcriptional regulator [Tahibacter amnicola]MCU7370313.1 LysR family transcriptional regulator [Paucibacter sp. O1-1]MDA3825298.1 LysR family transcriptional regulator [Paucibacter sp. O1-1]UXI65957.1 LysR family transcriptional regulator [Tahibacter amnicola]
MVRRFNHLGDLEAFVAVVDKGSITAGAVELGTTASVLSRAIARLEARLGAQLLRRTTRRLSLTEAGQIYLEHARGAFSLIDEGDRAVQGQGNEAQGLSGRVRMSVSTTYGNYRLPALLRPFLETHSQIQVELNISNRNVDLVAEGFDMAIRLGQLPDSSLIGRRLEDLPMCLVAAPDYLARMGVPQNLAELHRYEMLSFVMPSTGRAAPWLLRDEAGEDLEWPVPARIRVSDDVLGVVSLAEQGLGICQCYRFIAEQRLASGRLVEVLPQNNGRTRPCSLIYAPHRRLSAASRALIEWLASMSGR